MLTARLLKHGHFAAFLRLWTRNTCARVGLLLKLVASGAIDIELFRLLACAECEDHTGSDFVHIVGSGASPGGTVRSIEDAVMHVGRPPLVCIGAGYALELLYIAYFRGFAFKYQVEAATREGDDTVRIVCKVVAFHGALTCCDVVCAVDPERSHRHHMGSPVGSHRRQPGGSCFGQAVAYFSPRHYRGGIGGGIG